MLVIAVGILVIYAVLFLASARDEPLRTLAEHKSFLEKGFERMAGFLYKRITIHGIRLPFEDMVRKDLISMHPEENPEYLCTDYYVGKIAKCLMICLAATLLATVVSLKGRLEMGFTKEGTIERNTFLQGNRELNLKVDGDKEAYQVILNPMKIDNEELAEYKDRFSKALPDLICGDNPSLSEVTSNLNLSENYESYPFNVEWTSSDPGILSSSGKIWKETEHPLSLEAHISYDDLEWTETYEILLKKKPMTAEEQFHETLQEILVKSEKETREDKEFLLPEELEGRHLTWEQQVTDYGPVLLMMGIFTAVLIFGLSDRDLHSLLEKRKEDMRKEYPDVLHMLVLYLGAGMTIRGALHRIIADQDEKTMSPIHKEILITCRELNMGISESLAYEKLGKRTGLPEYMRLCALLSQNLKKGNAALLSRLREEAFRATNERLSSGKRLGEEAETKLLLPCVMMLAVVLIMLTIPAFTSIG